MLILSRKLDESILIGDSIVIKIVAVQEGHVKIGIDAPREVRILRSELYDEAQKSNTEAAAAQKGAAVEAARRMGKGTSAGLTLPPTVRPRDKGRS
jgi:carbon storage regulator